MLISSDIFLSVNVLRSIIGQPQSSEVTVVTQCNYPLANTTISENIEANGAMEFVKDIHALSTQ